MTYSSLTFGKWVNGFLKYRNLSKPDQRSLYAYHCTKEEYGELRHLLAELKGFNSASNDINACACLTLFCSEWYRREYKREYRWAWDPIYQVLGYSLSAAEIGVAVPLGLEDYWKRPLHFYESDRRDFLGSLFSEGGLPFNVLREGGGRFQTLFDRLLKQQEQAQLIGIGTYQQVLYQLGKARLPQVFSTRPSVELIASMLDQLSELVRDYDLTQVDEPVARLDAMSPRWRELFPLPLDLETGDELLNGLLNTATLESKRRRRESDGWTCKHYWDASRPDLISVRLGLPENLRFTLLMQPSTTRLELVLMEDGQNIADLGAAYATINDGIVSMRLRRREIVATRRNVSASLTLGALAGGALVASMPVVGSSIAMGEVPVGFEPCDEQWVLCGQASFSVSSQDVLVVLPEGANFEQFGQGDYLELCDAPSVCAYRSYQVKGRGQFQVSGDESYRVRLGQASSSGLGLEFVGKSLDWPTRPSLAFVGTPSVQWPAASEQLRQDCHLFIGTDPFDGHLSHDNMGVQFVSVRTSEGDTLLRRKVCLLPEDFSIELSNADQPGHGRISVFTHHRCLIQVLDEGLNVRQSRFDGYVELDLQANGLPPATVNLRVTASLHTDPVDIELPFPHTGSLAFDASGRPLTKDLCLDDLAGARLYLFGRADAPKRFTVELSLHGGAAHNASYSWRYSAGLKPMEISLFSMRDQIVDLMSLDSGIDQTAVLRVTGGAQDTYFRIHRYAVNFHQKPDMQTLSYESVHSTDTLPEPVLVLLHDPLRKAADLCPRTSQGVPTGEFETLDVIEKDGPWLVVPKRDSDVSFRPLYMPGDPQVASDENVSRSMRAAVVNFDPSSQVSTFLPVLDSMAFNPAHSGWQFLRELSENFGYLPMRTFEVWKALINHPQALCMALFKFETDVTFLGRLESEFPMLWEFLPIFEVRLAARRFKSFLKIKGLAEEVVDQIMSRMLTRLGDSLPAYGENLQKFLADKPVGADAQLPVEILQPLVHGWYQDLIRDRAEATWPEYHGDRLAKWYEQQSSQPILFAPEVGFRSSVFYFPVFAAAVSSGQTSIEDIFDGGAEAIFFLRQIRDFDTRWFHVIYQYALLDRLLKAQPSEASNE